MVISSTEIPPLRMAATARLAMSVDSASTTGMIADGCETTANFCFVARSHAASHLHTHCVVFNATFDPVEQRWKALQNYELLRARKFAETSITMNSPANCGVLVIRFATMHAGDFPNRGRVRSDLRTFFPNGTRRLTKHWQNCWTKNRN